MFMLNQLRNTIYLCVKPWRNTSELKVDDGKARRDVAALSWRRTRHEVKISHDVFLSRTGNLHISRSHKVVMGADFSVPSSTPVVDLNLATI